MFPVEQEVFRGRFDTPLSYSNFVLDTYILRAPRITHAMCNAYRYPPISS